MELLSDPAHLLYEVTLLVLIDLLALSLLWPLVRRRVDRLIHREHHLLDEEHGVAHGGARPCPT